MELPKPCDEKGTINIAKLEHLLPWAPELPEECRKPCRYDSLGRLTHAVCDGHSYEYLYNEDGQLKEKRSGGRRLISYTYDKAGQITELTDPAGVTTCYEYDLLGRTSRIYSREGMEVKYTYNCLDRPERITYGNGLETVYGYDSDSRVTHLETRHGDEILLSFRYEYDGNGNPISKTGIQPGIPGTDYATAGNCALDVSYQYDIRGQLLEEKQNEEVFRYIYDAAGNRVKKEDKEGITTYCYNEKNQLVSEEGLKGRNTFTYSRQGSILKKQSQSGESRYFYKNKNQLLNTRYLVDGENNGMAKFKYYSETVKPVLVLEEYIPIQIEWKRKKEVVQYLEYNDGYKSLLEIVIGSESRKIHKIIIPLCNNYVDKELAESCNIEALNNIGLDIITNSNKEQVKCNINIYI